MADNVKYNDLNNWLQNSKYLFDVNAHNVTELLHSLSYLGYRMNYCGIGFRYRAGHEISLFKASTPAVGPTHYPIHLVIGMLSATLSGRESKVSIYVYLVLRLRKRGRIPPLFSLLSYCSINEGETQNFTSTARTVLTCTVVLQKIYRTVFCEIFCYTLLEGGPKMRQELYT
jgi:hypothetical protein